MPAAYVEWVMEIFRWRRRGDGPVIGWRVMIELEVVRHPIRVNVSSKAFGLSSKLPCKGFVMRVSREEKDRSHVRIVESAARLVRSRGIDGTSVVDVMAEAGMSHGGFYRHFDTKEALLAAALRTAFDEILAFLEPQPGESAPEASPADYQAHYLSQAHVDTPTIGCPVAALGADVARGSDDLKAIFGAGVSRTIASLAKGKDGSDAERRRIATREFALMVGAVTIARASDPATARKILDACRGPRAAKPPGVPADRKRKRAS